MAAPSQGFATNYFIDPQDGNNAYNGLAVDSAFATTKKIKSLVQAGDTVFLRGGTYINQNIRIDSSGTPDSYIVFTRYQNEVPVLTDVTVGVALGGRSYVIIDGITIDGHAQSDTSLVASAMRMNKCHHIIVRNCVMQNTLMDVIDVADSSYQVKITNNTLGHAGVNSGGYREVIKISHGAHHVLVANNYLTQGTHNLVQLYLSDGFNIIRKNTMVNTWWRPMEILSGDHNTYNVVEDNIIRDSRMADSSYIPSPIKMRNSYNIVRRNRIYNNGNSAINFGPTNNLASPVEPSRKNKMYNNVMFANDKAGLVYYTTRAENPVDSNEFINNIVFDNIEEVQISISIAPNSDISDNFFFNNVIYKENSIENKTIKSSAYGSNTVGWYQGGHPTFFKNNIVKDPLVMDALGRDFHLQPASPGIDSGRFLTTAVGSGTGTLLPVKDAGYFCDGFGLIDGDTIQLEGKMNTAQVVSVDYDNNILTLDKPLAWSANQGVALAYSGIAPDIGVFEYQQTLPVRLKDMIKMKNSAKIRLPNPFEEGALLEFYLSQATRVEIGLYDLTGQKIRQLLDAQLTEGRQKIEFHNNDFAEGIYLFSFKINDMFILKKLLVTSQ